MTDARIVAGPQPKHQQLRGRLLAMAVPGQAIPSERELMGTYGVSRDTVRRAIDALVADGVLQRTHGLGTFAVRPRLETRLHLASFSLDMRRRGRVPSTRLVSVACRTPPAEVADALNLAADAQAWRVVRIRLADGEPVAHEDGWYPAELFPGLDGQDLAGGSLYEIFAQRYGIWIDHADQTLWGESASADLAAQLAAPPATALLVFRRTSRAAGRPVEHVVSRYRGDRYEVHMELGRPTSRSPRPSPSPPSPELSEFQPPIAG